MINLEQTKHQNIFAIILLSILSIVAFYPTAHNKYNMDDELVTHNHKYTSKGFDGIKEIWTNPYYSDNMGYAYGYRPVVLTCYAIEHGLFGESPETSHKVQLILYALLSIVLFLSLKKLFPQIPWHWILLTVVLFALHPLHSEVVASLKNRDEILAPLLGLLSFLSFLYLKKKNLNIAMIVAAAIFVLGLWSKKSILPLLAIWLFLYNDLDNFTQWQKFIGFQIYGLLVLIGVFDMNISLLFIGIFIVYTLLLAAWIYYLEEQIKSYDIGFIIKYGLGLFLIAYGFYINDILPMLIAALVLIFSLKSFNLLSFITLVGLLYLIAFQRGNHNLVLFIPTLILLYQEKILPYLSKDEKKSKTIFLGLLAITMLLAVFIKPKPVFIALAIMPLLAYFLPKIFKYIAIGLLIIATVYYFGFNTFWLYIVGIALLAILLIKALKPNFKYWHYVLAIAFLSINIPYLSSYINNIPEIQYSRLDAADTGIKLMDGRSLEFAENPLVANWHIGYKLSMAGQSMWNYISMSFYPYPLSFYYGFDTLKLHPFFSWASLGYWLGVILFFVLSYQVVRYWKRKGHQQWYWLSFIGLLIIAGSFLMFSNLLVLVAGIIGERLAFLTTLGIIILLISALAILAEEKSQLKYVPIGLSIILSVVMITWDMKRSKMWYNAPTLMQRDLAHTPNSAHGNNLYALSLMNYTMTEQIENGTKKQMQEVAISHFKKAVAIDPEFFNAAFDAGRAQMIIGDNEGALESFIYSTKINKTNFMEPYRNICHIYFTKANYEEADAWARKALSIEPNNQFWYQYLKQNE